MENEGYRILKKQIEELCRGQQHRVTALANCSAALFYGLKDVNWVGFYLADEDCLYLGPFQGKPACSPIAFGSGVCGKCAAELATVIVPDVHSFEGHIACDSESNSEIVVPVTVGGRLVAVIDADSKCFNRFGKSEAELFEHTAEIIKSFFDEIS